MKSFRQSVTTPHSGAVADAPLRLFHMRQAAVEHA